MKASRRARFKPFNFAVSLIRCTRVEDLGRAVGKPLYENVGIGTIIKRIGECNALVDDYNLSLYFTQQHRKAETECRDLCLTVGSKIVLIDFKAPDKITRTSREYRQVKTLVTELGLKIGLRNFFIGFLHATLSLDPPPDAEIYYMSIATPATTLFVSLERLMQELGGEPPTTPRTITLGSIRIRRVVPHSCMQWYNDEKELIRQTVRPQCGCRPCGLSEMLAILCLLYGCRGKPVDAVSACKKLFELYCSLSNLWQKRCYESCPSCGTLCLASVEIEMSGTTMYVEALPLARLLWGLRCCKVGYKIKDREELEELLAKLRVVREIMRERRVREDVEEASINVYMLAYTPGVGFYITPLVTFA